jgi:hypothetical protein
VAASFEYATHASGCPSHGSSQLNVAHVPTSVGCEFSVPASLTLDVSSCDDDSISQLDEMTSASGDQLPTEVEKSMMMYKGSHVSVSSKWLSAEAVYELFQQKRNELGDRCAEQDKITIDTQLLESLRRMSPIELRRIQAQIKEFKITHG